MPGTDSAAPPRVMHVITDLATGGAERMLADLAMAAHDAGEDPLVVTLVSGGRNAGRLRAAGVRVASVDMRRGPAALAGLARLARLIRRERPEIVQGWMYHADLAAQIALRLSGRRARTRLFHGIRCSNMDAARYGPGFRLVRRLCARLSRHTDGAVANSAEGRDWHRGLGYRPPAFAVIPNGLDPAPCRAAAGERQACRRELVVADDAFVILQAARVDPMKDWPTLIAALDRLPGTVCIAAGRGTESLPDRPGLLRLGERDDIPRLLAAADLAVLSSGRGEGFPNAVAEAMAAGLAVVATDTGDTRALVDDAGLVVPPGDPAALAEAIATLRDDPARRASLGARGAARIATDFTLERARQRFTAFWRDPSDLYTIRAAPVPDGTSGPD